MIIYWFVCFLSMGLCYIGIHAKGYGRTKKSICIAGVVSSIPLFLLSALRYGIGTDYFSYAQIYLRYVPLGTRYSLEPFFWGLCRLIYLWAGDNYHWMFVVISLIYVLIMMAAIYLLSDSPPMSIYFWVAMTYYMSSFNTIREHLGCAFLLLSIFFIKERKLIKFLICVGIASGFHYVCALFLVAYVLAYYKFTPKRVIVFSVIFLVLEKTIVSVLFSFLSNSLRYAKYLVYDVEIGVNSYLGIIIQLLILLLAMYIGGKYEVDDEFNIYFGLQTLALWISILSSSFIYANRVKWVFSIPSIIFLPYLVRRISNRTERLLIVMVLVFAFGVYGTIVVGMLGSYGVIPYNSLFHNKVM